MLRSPSYADHGAPWTTEDPISQPATDRGWHEVSYRLRFHDEGLPADAGPRQAERHTTRFPHVSETWHRGPLGASAAAIDVTPAHVSVPVVKRAEDGGGWVLRVCELAGRATVARIALPFLDRAWTGQLRAFDVVTLFVPDTPDAEVREVALTELDVNPAGGRACRRCDRCGKLTGRIRRRKPGCAASTSGPSCEPSDPSPSSLAPSSPRITGCRVSRSAGWCGGSWMTVSSRKPASSGWRAAARPASA